MAISFVADVAQFTPKTVETTQEREKLMFRIKAQIPPALLRKHIRAGEDRACRAWPMSSSIRKAAWPQRLQTGSSVQ